MKADIIFREGSQYNVLIEVYSGITLSGYIAKIDVKANTESLPILEFTTTDGSLIIADNNIILTIPSNSTIGLSGEYYWQLSLNTTDINAIKYPIYKFTILPSITI